MQKKVGAILLVAGTCIGSGMIALPMVLASLGLIPSLFLMLFIWFIMYYTSLVNLELNLQAGQGLSLGSLGKHFSGKGALWVGFVSIKLLSYALLAAFLYGGASILQQLIRSNINAEYGFNPIVGLYALLAVALLLLPVKVLDYFNRILFTALIVMVGILIIGLALEINWNSLPFFSPRYKEVSVWRALVPVVFTSFGFQVIFHTLTNYCHKNATMLKQAFFWGSLIPAIVYILWTSSVLGVVYHNNPEFYLKMVEGKIEIGALIQVLSNISGSQSIQLVIWWVSILAISTSVLGVGLGLCDAIKGMLVNRVPNKFTRSLLAALLTILPAYLVVIYVPNAFIAALAFAGMILAIIAILLPIYLLTKIKNQVPFYPELKRRWLLVLSFIVGVVVIVSELWNMC